METKKAMTQTMRVTSSPSSLWRSQSSVQASATAPARLQSSPLMLPPLVPTLDVAVVVADVAI